MNELYQNKLENFIKFLNWKNYSQRTINNYLSCLKKFLLIVKTHPSQLTQKDIDYFIKNYKFTSISQQNQYINSIKIFYTKILNSKLIKINLERPRKEKHLPRIIDQGIIKEKLSKIKNIKHKAILSLAYSVGLRVSEVINLKIEDIDSARMLIHIKNAKGKKDRFVPLSDNILALLRLYFKQFQPTEYLFNGQFSLQYSVGSCQKLFKKYIDKDGHFHLLRHAGATHCLEAGTDISLIQKMLGHNSIKTTMIYSHVSNKLLHSIQTPL